MPQRRRDETTTISAEYAFFLAETRGLRFALDYLDNCRIPRDILLRSVGAAGRRRADERRRSPRRD